MLIKVISFTDRGEALAKRIADAADGEASRCNAPLSLSDWTRENFKPDTGLIFVGATGICVRAISPYVKKKTEDPAVLVVDEAGRHVISLLSGHIGGANELARKIAGIIGADPVITTATDVNSLFAIDEWAKNMGLAILDSARIKDVSSKLLSGKKVKLASRFDVKGEAPEGVELGIIGPGSADDSPDAVITFLSGDVDRKVSLALIPKAVHIGVGCRKGIGLSKIKSCYEAFLSETGIIRESVKALASIDIKADEKALLSFADELDLPIDFYPAALLEEAPGEFTPSEFVKETTGVDNVCERSAVTSSGGELIAKKFSMDGVTMAAAVEEPDLTF